MRSTLMARIIFNLEVRPRMKHWGDRDAEENAESQPPSGEQVQLHGLWAVEFYTPSQIAGLFEGFQKLGWDKSDFGSRDSPSDWIRNQRNSMLGGGWFNLGFIHNVPQNSVFRRDRTAPLPESVDHASASIMTLTSSLTCMVMFFVYKEPRLDSFQQALAKPRTTFPSPLKGGGYSIHQPESQKRSDVMDIRTRCRTEAWHWFRANLPGTFSSEPTMPAEFPTSELVTTAAALSFPPQTEGVVAYRSYLDILGLGRAYDAWEAKDGSGLRIAQESRSGNSTLHLLTSIKQDRLSANAKAHHFGEGRFGGTAFADRTMQEFVARWGLNALFSLLQRRVNSLRDGVQGFAKSHHPATASLSALTGIELRSLDAVTLANDVAHFSNRRGWFMHNVTDFKPVEPRAYKGESFAESLRIHLATQAKWLSNADEQVRRAVSQQANLLATRANIRLQGWMAALTVMAIVLALVSIVTATNSGKAALEPLVSNFLRYFGLNA